MKDKAWFEDGSTTRAEIQHLAERPIEFRAFCWSGKNSFSARWKASLELLHQIESWSKEVPAAKHVIIAHSHGGTVAARAIAIASRENPRFKLEPPIKALICLSTPFAYLVPDADPRLFHALGAIFTIPILLVCRQFWQSFWFMLLMAPLVIPWFLSELLWFFHLLPEFRLERRSGRWSGRLDLPKWWYLPPSVPSAIRTFIIRATRDEAALTIGFTQSVNGVTDSLTRSFDDLPSFKLKSLLAWFGILILFMIIGFILFVTLSLAFPDLYELQESPVGLFFIMPFAAASAGLFYVIAFALIAFATGLFNPRNWHGTRVEVDMMPPETECSVKTFFSLTKLESPYLRHAIYQVPAVQRDIASILRAIADNVSPKLVAKEWFRDDD